MSAPYNGPYGRPMDPPPGRRPPPPPGAPRGAPPTRPYYPGGVPDPRYRPRPPPQQHPPPLSATESPDSPLSAEQWPLPPVPVAQGSPRTNSPRGGNKRRPPPLRGDYQGPTPDHSRSSPHTAPMNRPYPSNGSPNLSHHGTGQWTGNGYTSPVSPLSPEHQQFPSPQRQAPGRIPDYPNPPQTTYYQQRNQRAPPGPPPSARRGPPANYKQAAPVQSIPEEANGMRGGNQSENSLQPLANNAKTQVRIPTYYFMKHDGKQATPAPIGEEEHDPQLDESQDDASRGDSRADSRDEPSPEPVAMIRQASLGKKSRPTLTTVRSSGEPKKKDSSAESLTPIQQHNATGSREQLTPFEEEISNVPGAWVSEGPTPLEDNSDEKALVPTSAAPVDATTSSQSPSGEANTKRRSSDIFGSEVGAPLSDTASDLTPIASKDTLEAPQAKEQRRSRSRSPFAPGGFLSPRSPTDEKRPNSRISEKRKSPALNIDINAVREAEARGSMTSLPDLIRRATKLQRNLDRGKTASRVGMNFFDGMDSDQLEKYHQAMNGNNRNSGSVTDMLSAFPPPGSKDDRRSLGNFSSMLRNSQLPLGSRDGLEDDDNEKPKRQYCGMSPRMFVTLMVVLFLLVAAGIIVPVVLFLVSKHHHHLQPTFSGSPALQHCQADLTCQNGGVNIIGSGSACSCLCVNGYTGKTCETLSQSGCAKIHIGSTQDATIGQSLPPLLSAAKPDLNIPLDGETLLGLFSSSGLSCSDENSLVTFKNAAKRSARASPEPDSSLASSLTARSTSGSTLDFAGTAVLYIFQASGQLNDAETAHKSLQSVFDSGQANAKNVSLGNGFSCDLQKRNLVWNLANGTVVAN